jgi:hypothetical protein
MTKWVFAMLACLAGSAWADDNLVKNGDFEKKQGRSLPQFWSAFSTDKNRWYGTISREDASKGSSSLVFLNTETRPEYQGIYQEVRVRPGQQFEFSVYVANNPDQPLRGSSRGQLSIEWFDAQKKEIARDWSQSWGAHVSGEKWVKFSMGGTAPPKAVQGHFVITLFSEGETSGGFLVDDVSVVKTK